jgi:hypothetical protein
MRLLLVRVFLLAALNHVCLLLLIRQEKIMSACPLSLPDVISEGTEQASFLFRLGFLYIWTAQLQSQPAVIAAVEFWEAG